MGAVRELFLLFGVVLDMLAAGLIAVALLLADRQVAPRGPATVWVPLPALSVEDHAARGRLWWIEGGDDIDYALDVAALDYVPAQSTVRYVGRMIYWCGTPLYSAAGATVPERYLLLRAIRLQRQYAPEEAERGPYVVDAACSTPGCSGRVSIGLSM
jgi:hypothetical protein